MRFVDFDRRVVFAAFDRGEITSDAGVLLLRERARQTNLFHHMAACFSDRRDPVRVRHELEDLLAQRVCAIALGYKDINDHDHLRHDPALKLLASPPSRCADDVAALASKSTLNRLEQNWETVDRRYHAFTPNLKKLSDLFVQLFFKSRDQPPEQITLDIDATDIEGHGHQENSFFHGYYEHRCFLPLYTGHYRVIRR